MGYFENKKEANTRAKTDEMLYSRSRLKGPEYNSQMRDIQAQKNYRIAHGKSTADLDQQEKDLKSGRRKAQFSDARESEVGQILTSTFLQLVTTTISVVGETIKESIENKRASKSAQPVTYIENPESAPALEETSNVTRMTKEEKKEYYDLLAEKENPTETQLRTIEKLEKELFGE